jgi:hypothetical protein
MILWIIVGYCVTAVLFYGYLLATAQPDPYEAIDEQYVPRPEMRKAA